MIYLKFIALVLFIAKNIDISSACGCSQDYHFLSPHQRFCNSEIVIKFRVAQVRCIFPPRQFRRDYNEYNNEESVDLPRSIELTKENQHDRSHTVTKENQYERATMTSRCDDYHYRIHILKVFKGEFLENSYTYFKTPAGVSCSTQLDLGESYYVMTNNIKMAVHNCIWSVKANEELSTMLDDTMMEQFGCGCEECSFCTRDVYGDGPLVCPGTRNSSCGVLPPRRLGLNHLVGRACRRSETGVCEWSMIGDETNALKWFYPRPNPPTGAHYGFTDDYRMGRSDDVYEDPIMAEYDDYRTEPSDAVYDYRMGPSDAVYEDRTGPAYRDEYDVDEVVVDECAGEGCVEVENDNIRNTKWVRRFRETGEVYYVLEPIDNYDSYDNEHNDKATTDAVYDDSTVPTEPLPYFRMPTFHWRDGVIIGHSYEPQTVSDVVQDPEPTEAHPTTEIIETKPIYEEKPSNPTNPKIKYVYGRK